jgi:DNA polymerase I-like protein with 3'-5' exonuclease and polymerase domains
MFQGLAADGAKLALWKLWRAGYRLVNFIHDEILVELPEGSNLALHAEIVRRIMIETMQQVVPDVNIDVQYSISEMWAKNAEVVVDEEGRLAVWKPVDQDSKPTREKLLMAMSA